MSTNIVISKETRNRLCKVGRKNQTYDDIINELIQTRKESGQRLVGFAEPTNQESA